MNPTDDADAQKILQLQQMIQEIYLFHHNGGDNDPSCLFRIHHDAISHYISHILPKNLLSFSPEDSLEKSTLIQWLMEFFTAYFPKGHFQLPLSDQSIQTDSSEITLLWPKKSQWLYQVPDYYQQYHFSCQEWTIYFFLSSETANMAGRIKEKRYYILDRPEKDGLQMDSEAKTLLIYFSYRLLRQKEKIQFKTHYQTNLNRWALTTLEPIISPALNWSETNKTLALHLKTYTSVRNPIKSLYPDLNMHFSAAQLKFIQQHLPSLFTSEDSASFSNKLGKIPSFINHFTQISQETMRWYLQIEHVRLAFFRKKKFVLKSSYNLSTSKVSRSYFPQIVKNTRQVAFWRELYHINPEIPITPEFLDTHLSLVIDTQYYSLEDRIHLLQKIPHLEKETTGLIIKSENWQALNLLLPLYQQQIQMIYIDPPYNTGTDFIYHDNLARSSWLTVMASRLYLAQLFLKSHGIFFASIDDNELAAFSLLVENTFSEGKRLDNIVWHKKTQPSFLSKELIKVTEYIVVARNSRDQPIRLMGGFGNQQKLTELINIGNAVCQRILPRDHVIVGNNWSGTLSATFYGKDALQVELQKGPVRVAGGIPDQDLVVQSRFKWTQKRLDEEIEKGGQIYIKNIKSLRPTILRAYKEPIIKAPITLLSKKVNMELKIPTNTDANAELKRLFQIPPFDYPKPTRLIAYLIRAATYFSKMGIILDFFAGSGTTAHATLDLNAQDEGSRKYVLIEQAASFDKVLKPRIQKIMYSSTWKDGKPLDGISSGYPHIFKSLVLEQVDDCYWNLARKSPMSQFIRKPGKNHSHVLEYIIDWEDPRQPISLTNQIFEHPFDYSMIVTENGVLKEQSVDLVETFNYLIGIQIQKYDTFTHQNRTYCVIHGVIENSEENKQNVIIIWRDLTDLNFESEVEFLRETLHNTGIISKTSIYLNGISCFPKAHLIEPLFLRKMFTFH
ncbi:MAG: DNA methyltransferase [Promethearchaeota archaeon]